jgi:hypothetical protein
MTVKFFGIVILIAVVIFVAYPLIVPPLTLSFSTMTDSPITQSLSGK